jgi:molybdopterin-containing oxidoreductase family membrane subunit
MAAHATTGKQPANVGYEEIDRIIEPSHTYETATDKLSKIVLVNKHPLFWWVCMLVGAFLVVLLQGVITQLVSTGIGIWGNNQPVAWGFDIINFVWWIGIGHAGTLISAILFLFRQEWRTSINRFAESMTIFAVMCAGMYPLLHLGRPWLFYWLFPYPNVMRMWPQFRSPLMWDVFAVSTYFSVSLLFWFTGLVPDFATLRDRAKSRIQKVVYGILSCGWRGSAIHWQRYEVAYLILAGLSTPLVVSVHSIVSLDFAVSLLPGWHTTIFPPYFVAGAIFSGFAMVLTFAIPVRHFYGLKDLITQRHLDAMSKVMLATGLLVCYGYAMEAFVAWYSGNRYERFMMLNRMFGGYGWSYWMLIFCNAVAPQLLWSRKIRTSTWPLWIITIIINIGMWFERFVILMTLNADFVPSSWGMYAPTKWDIGMFLGTIGFFVFMMMMFMRFLPMISLFEVRELLHKKVAPHGDRPLH